MAHVKRVFQRKGFVLRTTARAGWEESTVGSGEVVPDRPSDGVGARAEGELGEAVTDVGGCRALAGEERRGDLPARAAGEHQA
jgi:hypothetical protein